MLQGIILHRAIAEGGLDRIFEHECKEHNIPATYRKEAVRLELLRHFEAFQADTQWPLKWRGVAEKEFEIALTPELTIRGRIDRLLSGPSKEAIVIDYKYSTVATLRGTRINARPPCKEAFIFWQRNGPSIKNQWACSIAGCANP